MTISVNRPFISGIGRPDNARTAETHTSGQVVGDGPWSAGCKAPSSAVDPQAPSAQSLSQAQGAMEKMSANWDETTTVAHSGAASKASDLSFEVENLLSGLKGLGTINPAQPGPSMGLQVLNMVAGCFQNLSALKAA